MNKPRKRSALATVLALPAFRQRKVKPRKGKGSYTRKGRLKNRPFAYSGQVVNLNNSLPTC